MCGITKFFLVTEAEMKHVRRRAPFQQTLRRKLPSSFFPARQDAERNSCHSDRNIVGKYTILCHSHILGGPV
jgi:hypothetical protein